MQNVSGRFLTAKEKVNSPITKNRGKSVLSFLFRWVLIIEVSFIIISPMISVLSDAFKTREDAINPLVYLVPQHFTLQNMLTAMNYMKFSTIFFSSVFYVTILTVIQVFVCALVGYGFARFKFPFSNVLFVGVILTIVIPTNMILVPMYMQFYSFDFFGVIKLVTGRPLNLINTWAPVIMLYLTASGLRSGLFIFIYRQFFRGLPAEIEEAATIDGAGILKTFFHIMLPNAVPSIITVTMFSFVWQYYDTFYSTLLMPNKNFLSTMLASITDGLNQSTGYDFYSVRLGSNAGILLVIVPIILCYCFLQRFFIESVERSGVVG